LWFSSPEQNLVPLDLADDRQAVNDAPGALRGRRAHILDLGALIFPHVLILPALRRRAFFRSTRSRLYFNFAPFHANTSVTVSANGGKTIQGASSFLNLFTQIMLHFASFVFIYIRGKRNPFQLGRFL
jgi:hypothetical protein